MIERWMVFTTAALICFVPISSLATPADTLWLKAVSLSEANYEWMPGTVHERENVYDNKDNLKDSGERTYRFFLRDGELDVELVGATKNGEDAFKDIAEELEKEKDKLLSDDHDGDPFHVDNQSAVHPRRLGHTEVLDGTPCVRFEYEIEKKGRMWSGTAWLDHHSGAPLRTCIRPAEFPHKVGKVKFSELEVTTTFKIGGDGRWVTDSMLAEGRFKVKPIPFYTFKGRFEETTTLSDYWRCEQN